MRPDIVVFDLGGVLIDWNPRYLYRKLFPGREEEMERFLAEICTNEWNIEQDRGRSWADALELLKGQHPEYAELIDAYHQRWDEMLAGAIEGSVAILRELKASGTRLYALTNWSHETFPIARERFDFLTLFDGIIVSGEAKLIKPDRRIFDLMLQRFSLRPERVAYIDDSAKNADAAAALGMHAIRFTSPEALRDQLAQLDLLPTRQASPRPPGP